MRGKTKNHCTHNNKNDGEHGNINVWVPTIFMRYGYKLASINNHIYLSIYYILDDNLWEILFWYSLSIAGGIKWIVSPEILWQITHK